MTASIDRTNISGFSALELSTQEIKAAVVPALGAKIVSLYDKISNREWCWHPGNHLELFENSCGDSFDSSPLTGIDECFPTIERCRAEYGELPCHGELWSKPWETETIFETSGIRSKISCESSPFHLQRTIQLRANRLDLKYKVTNNGPRPASYLWAFHPLLRIKPHDEIQLPIEVGQIEIESASGIPAFPGSKRWKWPEPFPDFRLDRFQLGDNTRQVFKAFSPRLSEGRASITNSKTSESLTLLWDTNQNPHLGIWMTRGGYRDFQDVAAFEPTNAPTDSLASAFNRSDITLEAGEARRWSVSIELTPSLS